jgi:pyruvate formate lyase activating enzyme
MQTELSLAYAVAVANNMKIAGLVRSSLIDYPGGVAAVVFTQGCNFRCGFCHNPDLISLQPQASSIPLSETDFLDFLEKRIGKLDGVVITGGEPLIQPDIEEFIVKIKALGFAVKLDTNGSNPKKLSTLITNKLIDYIAMDIKGPLAKYADICAYPNTKVIQRSVKIIIDSGLPYEFRTTVLPAYHEARDFVQIGELIKGASVYTIQGFRPQITLDPVLADAKPFSTEELKKFSDIMTPYVGKVVIHPNQ